MGAVTSRLPTGTFLYRSTSYDVRYRSLRSDHPFLHSSPFYQIPRNPVLYNGLDAPLKVPLPVGASTPSCNSRFLGSTRRSTPNGNLDRFSRFWATVCKSVRPMLSESCLSVLSCLSVCNVGVLWPNGWMDQDATWYGGRPQPRGLCVRWGRPSQLPQIFGPCLL